MDILPGTATIPPAAAVAGFLIAKAQSFRMINSIALVLLTLGFGFTSLLRPESNKGMQLGFQILYGIGGGILFPGRQIAIQASQKDEDVPMATALSSFTICLGQTFGVAIGGAIFQNVWSQKVAENIASGLLPAEFALSRLEAEQAGRLMAAFPDDIQMIYRGIVSQSVNAIFIVLAAFSAAATVGSFFSRNLSLDKDSSSSQAFIDKRSIKNHEAHEMPRWP